MLEFTVKSPESVGLVHADPHPGNFMLLPDGRFGIIDFGAVSSTPAAFRRSSVRCCAGRAMSSGTR